MKSVRTPRVGGFFLTHTVHHCLHAITDAGLLLIPKWVDCLGPM